MSNQPTSTRGGARPNSGRKPLAEKTSILHIRVPTAEKAHWVKTAQPQKLSEWVRASLNKAAK